MRVLIIMCATLLFSTVGATSSPCNWTGVPPIPAGASTHDNPTAEATCHVATGVGPMVTIYASEAICRQWVADAKVLNERGPLKGDTPCDHPQRTDPDLDRQIQEWEALPEDPEMRDVCITDLRYSTEIATRKNHGATVAALLRWAEQESENSAKQMPTETLMPVGTELILMHLVRRSFNDQMIYSRIAGGFPQWIYRSCLKGKSLD